MKTKLVSVSIVIGLLLLSNKARSQNTPHYSQYISSDFQYFRNANSTDSVYNCFYHLIHANYEVAISSMFAYLKSHPNDEKLKQELANALVLQKRYKEANDLLNIEDSLSNPMYYFSSYAEPHFQILKNKVVLPFFDNFYTTCTVNGKPDSLILDTGVRITIISKSYAKKHNLKIDSQSISSKITGNNISSNWSSAQIEELKLGEHISISNLPCFVVDDLVFNQFGIKNHIAIGLDVFTSFDQIEFDYINAEFIVVHKEDSKVKFTPNFHILGLMPITRIGLNSEFVNGFIDTGSPFTYIYKSQKFSNEDRKPSKSIEKNFRGYKYTEQYFPFEVQSNACWSGQNDLKIRSAKPLSPIYNVELLIGHESWSHDKLLINFRSNYCCLGRGDN